MKALLVAGGSGGHLIPALALAERLGSSGSCLILSTSRPVDRIVAHGSGLEWMTVDLKPLAPWWRWFSPGYTLHQCRAIRHVWRSIRQVQPDVVVGFGGYLSAVGILAGYLSQFPTVIHEQNVLPGRANRWLSFLADEVAVSFSETKDHLTPRARVEVTGNPIRSAMGKVEFEQARAYFGFDLKRPVLLVMGGSQGSSAINAVSLAMWEGRSWEDRQRIQVLHLAGLAQATEVEVAYRRWGIHARVFPFLKEFHMALAAASLAIARAGATVIAELMAVQLPALLIPYPYAGGHQRANAHWMEARGAAVVLEQKSLTLQRLWEEVGCLLWNDPERLERMRSTFSLNGDKGDGSAVDCLGALVEKTARAKSSTALPRSVQ